MLAWLVPDGRPMFRSIFATFLPQREIEIIVEEMPSTSKRKTDRLLPFTILPPSLPSGSCRRMLFIAKQGKSYQRKPEPRMKTQCKPKTSNLFLGKFVEIYISNIFQDYLLGLVATNTHFFH